MELIKFEQQKEEILNTVALIDANVKKVKQLLNQADKTEVEPKNAALIFYDTTIEKYKPLVLSMIEMCETLEVLYNKNKHALDVEIQIRQGRISEN